MENLEDFLNDEKAMRILGVLHSGRKQKPGEDKNKALKRLLGHIRNAEKRTGTLNPFSPWLQIAVITLIVLILSIVWKNSSESLSSSCKIIVPIGEKSQVVLPDGTHVWINAGSTFLYAGNFGEKDREVYLEGEAFFDVTKQKGGKPFIVNTKVVRVRVLGTAFNLKCYDSDKTVETTVVRGLVKVESSSDRKNSIYLNPNEKAIFTKNNISFKDRGEPAAKPGRKTTENAEAELPLKVIKTNPETVTSWKDQLLVFNDETFEDMAVKMERWYNMKIVINDSVLRTERFNGKFVHNETVYQVLEAIKITTPIKYKVEENTILITRK